MNVISRLTTLEHRRRRRPVKPGPGERNRYAWFADSCPCGKPPGDCRDHPRARPEQRPPDGQWKTWLMLAGRAGGKTRSGAEWVRSIAESHPRGRIALVAPTAADVRDVMVEGDSGLLAICPPWNRPKYEPSKRRLIWPNGAIATTYSGDEPERLRGPQHAYAWLDELCAFRRSVAAWDNLMFGLRLGADPRVLVTTTPKPSKLLKELLADATTKLVRFSSYANRANVAPTFFEKIVAKYEGSRLGDQELHAEVVEISEGAWFARFDTKKHVSETAEYDHRFPVHLAIDAGTSCTTAAVWFQVRPVDAYRNKVTVFGDYCVEGLFSEANASAIKAKSDDLPSRGRVDTIRLDPAATARSGIGPAAFGEYERVFGSRILAYWPTHRVADGLDQLEVLLDQGCLILHPRCQATKAAFQNYSRRRTASGDWLNEPAKEQSPYEDSMDALRGGIRDRFPEGRTPQPSYRQVHVSRLF